MKLIGKDKELIDSLCPNELDRFEQWFKELNEVHGETNHYGEGCLSELTGVKCWFDYFTNGDSPRYALNEDLTYA